MQIVLKAKLASGRVQARRKETAAKLRARSEVALAQESWQSAMMNGRMENEASDRRTSCAERQFASQKPEAYPFAGGRH